MNNAKRPKTKQLCVESILFSLFCISPCFLCPVDIVNRFLKVAAFYSSILNLCCRVRCSQIPCPQPDVILLKNVSTRCGEVDCNNCDWSACQLRLWPVSMHALFIIAMTTAPATAHTLSFLSRPCSASCETKGIFIREK